MNAAIRSVTAAGHAPSSVGQESAHLSAPAAVPPFAIHRLLTALLAFGCFSLTASATYIVNDLLDIEADRRHPQKACGPLPREILSALSGAGLAAVLCSCAGLSARDCFPWASSAGCSSTSHDAGLLRLSEADCARGCAGALRLVYLAPARRRRGHRTPISHWLGGFSVFLFFSLAMPSVRELENLRASGSTPKNGRGYLLADIDQLRSFGTSSAFAAVVILPSTSAGTK